MSAAFSKRFEAVFLCTHPRGPRMSVAAAARYMKKSQSFVRKWVQRYNETQTVDDLPERGVSAATTKRQDNMIIKMFRENPGLTLRQAQSKLVRKGVEISIKTISRRLRAAKINWRSTKFKPLLSQKHIHHRLLWAQENYSRHWNNVVFTDEASFWAWTPRRKAWVAHGSSVLERTVKHPLKIHVWGCFNVRGFGSLYLFTGNLNAKKMVEIYRKCLLKSAKKWFGEGATDWILQEDNDPKHRSRLCTAWKAENGITVLDWPSQSPDANPIENVWAYIKMKLKGKRLSNLKQLSYQIKSIWRSLGIDYAENLVASMEKRCQAMIDNNGDWTAY